MDASQYAGVPGGEIACAHLGGDLVFQGQQAQAVGDRGAGLAQAFRGLFLGIAALVHQGADAFGFFDGVQVLALQVLHQRGFHLLLA